VPRSKLPEMMRFIAECSRKYQLRIPNVFHAGDGNLHPLILYDERDADQVRRTLAASDAILNQCIALGGSVTASTGSGWKKWISWRNNFRRMTWMRCGSFGLCSIRRAAAIRTKCFPARSAAPISRRGGRPRRDGRLRKDPL